jgi:hypothetical protein
MSDQPYATNLLADLDARLSALRSQQTTTRSVPERTPRAERPYVEPLQRTGLPDITPAMAMVIQLNFLNERIHQSIDSLNALASAGPGAGRTEVWTDLAGDLSDTSDNIQRAQRAAEEMEARVNDRAPEPLSALLSVGQPTPDDPDAVLSRRIRRLAHLRDWIHDDPELRTLVDTSISSHVRAAEARLEAKARAQNRQQAILAVALTAVSLLAGWLLSLVGSPATIANLLPHH